MIQINQEIELTEIRPNDKPQYISLFKEKEIYDNTLNIPFPYTEADADFWIELNQRKLKEQPTPVSFAIRNKEGLLIGGVGLDGLKIGKSHKYEIGYWLGKPYWGQGIMTLAVKRVCLEAFQNWGLQKITAHVFKHNIGSQRVLEKTGFQLEGKLRQHYVKDGRIFDGRIYGLLKEEFKSNELG